MGGVRRGRTRACAARAPGAEHLISYHIVTSGSCWGGVEDEAQVLLEPGDVIVFPHGDAHLLSSDEGNRLDPSI